MEQRIFFFGSGSADGDASMKDALGGKGANLAEMARLGIPVPPGFTISTRVCVEYLKKPAVLDEIWKDILAALGRVEFAMGKKFGDAANPLLVSVRSGSRFSMPGMMDTILNLGLNAETARGLAARSGKEAFALDCERRLIEKFGEIVKGAPHGAFDKVLSEARKTRGVEHDHQLDSSDWKKVIARYGEIYRAHAKEEFPADPRVQLRAAVEAVFKSWNNARAATYRDLNGIPHDLGTAVTVQAMVFGNMDNESATGVAFTRNPSTGENAFYGEYLPNAQGEDVVAGIRTPYPIRSAEAMHGEPSLEARLPAAYAELCGIRERLEKHYRDMMDIEFTVESGRLYMLQARVGKRTGVAALRMACEMADEGLIRAEEAVMRVEPAHLTQILAPTFDDSAKAAALKDGKLLAKGLNAGPGAASGRVALSAEEAMAMAKKGARVILVRVETSPEDVAGMIASQGILTARGGMTSHAAVVARGMGKACVTGCKELDVDYEKREVRVRGKVVHPGDPISIDGTTGEVLAGDIPTRPSEVVRVMVEKSLPAKDAPLYRLYARFMAFADGARDMKVRANADTPNDAAVARGFGAEGVGLCRTEHMFFDEERIPIVREMILAADESARRKALEKLLPYQREDFKGIFRAMAGLPVTVRLLDPPLHEFLPHEDAAVANLAKHMGVSEEVVRAKVESLKEANPMLGHRGCRLAVTYPEIAEMQVRAILEAACAVKKESAETEVEIMIPLIVHEAEFDYLRPRIEKVAEAVFAEAGAKVKFIVGANVETPRACLRSEVIAKRADFFSFGTNDLTQTTFGFSRDDAGTFLPEYVAKGILPEDPFQRLDRDGVGALMKMCVENGRRGNPKLKVGICGEHGGEPTSVAFCHAVGLDYVSCSPYRVPIARLAAAQAALEKRGAVKRGDTR